MDKYVGKRLDGRYEIEELIGIGGMSLVYKAFDTVDKRTVSIKILKEEYLDNRDFLRRFKNESKAVAVLSHPNIVKIYDMSFGDLMQYIVMEYIDGITLKEFIESNGPISWKDTVHFTTQILKALKHAHDKGIIHRDIKPQNILLLGDGSIKITDFGIAKFTSNETRTITDKAIGSVHYISPEQAKGDVVDEKTDIYSTGVTMYEMLTGQLPFNADNAVSVAIMQMQNKPKPIHEINPDIPSGLEDITMKAMQKLPINRYNSAGSMLAAIHKFTENPSIKFAYKYLTNDSPTQYINNNSSDISSSTSYGDDYSHQPSEDNYYYDNDDDIASNKFKKKKYTKTIVWTSAVVVVFAAILTICALLGVFSSSGDDVDVPNFIGMNYDDVKNNTTYKFKFETTTTYTKNKAEGEIVDQNPKAGSKKVKANAIIKLTINSSSATVTIPNLKGQDKQTAVEKLKSLGLTAQVSTKPDSSVEKGNVIETNPTAGSIVRLYETVYVYVSDGNATMPDVTGKSYDDAVKILKNQNLTVSSTKEEDSDQAKGTVIRTTPAAGSDIDDNTSIVLILSSGNKGKQDVTFSIDLPNTQEINVKMDIYSGSELIDTKYVRTNGGSAFESVSIYGDETKIITVYLNDQQYKRYSVNSSGATLINTYNYQNNSSE